MHAGAPHGGIGRTKHRSAMEMQKIFMHLPYRRPCDVTVPLIPCTNLNMQARSGVEKNCDVELWREDVGSVKRLIGWNPGTWLSVSTAVDRIFTICGPKGLTLR